VLAWLATAAPVRGFDGFAIGRTLWQEALEGYVAGATTREEARDAIADRYLYAIEAYVQSSRRGREDRHAGAEVLRQRDERAPVRGA
jgi:myo-inositol catabolism protein IolC